ncbi:zincin-like metallopeptidase domain-containing protein [Lactococcus garvieae]|uniref:zincin-like metallopeptidase domain-containing protein n=1 Tax=Lactococcus garvieae TaxID=1363 RepID=UPI0038550972
MPTRKDKQEETDALSTLIKDKDYKGLSAHLKAGIGAYLESDTFKNYLNFVSTFYRYSDRNVRLILAQNPHARHVESFNAWKNRDNPVKKGGKALYIYAPQMVYKKDQEGRKVTDENGEFVKETYFKLTPVFDESQTQYPEQLPRPIYAIEENMEDPEHFAKLYLGLTKLSQIEVRMEQMEGQAQGYYLPDDNLIVLKKGLGQVQTIKTLIHEMTHARLHTNSSARFGDEVYSRQEFEAEAVAYIVCQHLNIDTSTYSFAYLSSWTERGEKLEELEESLHTITQEAKEMITSIEQTLEKAYTLEGPRNKFEERLATLKSDPTMQKGGQKIHKTMSKQARPQPLK